MCIQNLDKLRPLVHEILSGNEMVTDLRNSGITEGQGKCNIAPTFSSKFEKNETLQPNISIIMCIQNLLKFCPLVLKILSGNEILTSIKGYNSVANVQKIVL